MDIVQEDLLDDAEGHFGQAFYLDDNDEDAPIFPPEPLSDIAIASSGLMDKIVTYLNKAKRKWTDINTWTGQTGVMYAITGKRMDIVQKFIECGINLNAGDEKHWTPLHYAVSTNNVECVCLFLNYGVDVRIKSNHQETPLTLAFGFKQQEIMKYLLNFYYEFANINLTNIKFDFKYGLGNNREDIILLTIALENGLMEPFEIIWERIDLEEIINLPTDRLIQKYLYQSLFAPSSKLHCIEIADIRYVLNNIAFFLQNAFLSKNFDHTRRMALLFMLLSTGVRVSLDNIRHIYQVCGFNKELEALIYPANHDWSGLQQINADNVLLHFILNFFELLRTVEIHAQVSSK